MASDDDALAHFAKQRDALFENVQRANAKEVLGLACPVCGGALIIHWMRQLIPMAGRDALNIRCNDDRCAFSIQADGKIARPGWAGFFSGTLTTSPTLLARPKITHAGPPNSH